MNKTYLKAAAVLLPTLLVALYLVFGGIIAAEAQVLVSKDKNNPTNEDIALAGMLLKPHKQIARLVGKWFYRFQQRQYEWALRPDA